MRTPDTQSERSQTMPQAEIKNHGFFVTALGALLLFVAMAAPALAVDSVWDTIASDGNWNNGGNWNTGIPPEIAGDTATFNTSTITSLSLSGDVTIDSMTFNSGADAFTIETNGNSFSFVGVGIVNNSVERQTIINDFDVATNFLNNSTAGNATIINSLDGATNFLNSSNAGNATIINSNADVDLGAGMTNFRETSTASNATITNEGGDVFGEGGATGFFDSSHAGNATITNEGGTADGTSGGTTQFFNTSTADNATITNEGGTVDGASGGATGFFDTSTAGDATITNNGSFVSIAGGGSTTFQNSSTAANATITNNASTIAGGGSGLTEFFDTSTAGNATITNNASTIASGNPGLTEFFGTSTAGNATITNNATTIAGGGGGLTFFRDTSTAGNATITNNASTIAGGGGGVTEFFDTSTAGNATITNNGSTIAGGIAGLTTFVGTSNAGNATITNNGSTIAGNNGGVTNFFGTSNAGNATLIANGGSGGGFGGTILFENDSTGGTARVEVFGNGNLDISGHSPSVTIGSIEGDGDVFLGANNLTVGSNNLSTLFSGVVQDGGPSGGTGGSLTKVGTGTLTLSGTNTYTGLTTVRETGILNIQNGSALGATTAGTFVEGGATLQLQGGISVGAEALGINGAGAAGQNGALVNVSGTNNYGGLLTLGAASTISSDAGTLNLTNTGTITGAGFGLTLTGAGNGTISSIIGTGTGTLTKNGVGTWTLSGENTYTGATTVDGGRLIVEGSISGAQTSVNNGGSLIVNAGGSISSTQTWVNNGGSLIVDGSISGAQTTVNGGSLIVDGSISSGQTLVNARGLLSGNGSLGGDLLNSGIVSPGNSPGRLTVGGNYTQTTGGILRIEIAGLGANQHDMLVVNGKATLAGTLEVIPLNPFQFETGNKITFLTAKGGVSGTFKPLENPFLLISIDNSSIPKTVALEVVAVSAPPPFVSIDNIAASLARIQFVNLSRRMDEIHAERGRGFSSTGLNINGSLPNFSGGLAGPTGPEGKSGPSVMLFTPENRWGVFVTGLGEFNNVGDTSNARGFDLTTGGLTFGADYLVSPNFAIGLTGGYANTNADLGNNGSLDVNGGTIGAYATGFGGGFYVNTAAFGVFNGYDSHRTALLGIASGNTDGQDFNAGVEAGYDWNDWKHGGLTIGPLASFQYTYVGFDGFTEHGSVAPLSFSNQNAESTRTALGAKASYDWHVGNVVVKPELRAAWQHEFGDTEYSIVSRLANGAGNSFTVNGPAIGRDSLLIGAGAAVLLNDRVSVYAYYDGELARTNYSSNNVSAGVRVSF